MSFVIEISISEFGPIVLVTWMCKFQNFMAAGERTTGNADKLPSM